MTPYRNLSGDSAVESYEIAERSITVRFRNGGTYLYDYATTGPHNVEQMKGLALAGSGLNSFINRFVRKAYAAKMG